jgi:hypothetical protein
MISPALCKVCLYYNPGDKTCARSVVAAAPGKVYHDYAKIVRYDPKQCGPKGKWFEPLMGKDGLSKTPVEELFESIDI